MEEESSIYKSTEEENLKPIDESKFQNYFYPLHERKNIKNNDIQNIIHNKFNNQNNINQLRLGQEPSKAQVYHYEKIIYDLSIKIEDLNSNIEKLHLELDKSKEIINGQKIEIKILKEQILNQENKEKELSEKNMENEQIINELKNLNQKMVNNSKIKFETLNKEINEKEKIINEINKQIKAKEETIKYFTINNNLSKKYSNNFKNELEKQKMINKNLEEKIEQLNKQIDSLYAQNQSEGSFLIEIERLKDDNIRLLQMLKALKHSEDLDILSTEASTIKKIKAYDNNEQNKNNNNTNTKLLNEAYCYGLKLRQKFGIEMSNTVLRNFVVGLNRVWQDKYEKELKEIKKNYQKQLDYFYSQAPIDNQPKTIKNLSSDNISINSLNNNNINNDNKLNIRNNNFIKNNNDYEKGCFWMISRCDEEFDDLNKNIEELFLEYEEKLNNSLNGFNGDNVEYYLRIINNCVKWFFSSLKSMANNSTNKIKDWKKEIKIKFESS